MKQGNAEAGMLLNILLLFLILTSQAHANIYATKPDHNEIDSGSVQPPNVQVYQIQNPMFFLGQYANDGIASNHFGPPICPLTACANILCTIKNTNNTNHHGVYAINNGYAPSTSTTTNNPYTLSFNPTTCQYTVNFNPYNSSTMGLYTHIDGYIPITFSCIIFCQPLAANQTQCYGNICSQTTSGASTCSTNNPNNEGSQCLRLS